MNTEANRLVQYLRKNKLKLALAESMTGGLAAHQLAGCKGASDALSGSIVCYSPEVKTSLLTVPETVIKACTCESMQVTELLAKNLTKLIDADVYGAITGLASEGGSESPRKPVGTTFICVYYSNRAYKVKKRFRGSPLQVRKKACEELYRLLRATLQSEKGKLPAARR